MPARLKQIVRSQRGPPRVCLVIGNGKNPGFTRTKRVAGPVGAGTEELEGTTWRERTNLSITNEEMEHGRKRDVKRQIRAA